MRDLIAAWTIAGVCLMAGPATAQREDPRPVSYAHADLAGGRLGVALAVDGDRAAMGAPDLDTVEILSLRDGAWSRSDLLTPLDATGLSFGATLDLQGDTLAVGRPDGPLSRDVGVLVYDFDGTRWNPVPVPPASRPEYTGLGDTLDLDGDRLFTTTMANRGAAVIYRRQAGAWVEEDLLVPASGDQFFSPMIVADGERLVFLDRVQGQIDEYAFDGTEWGFVQRLLPPSGFTLSYANNVVLRGDELFVSDLSFDLDQDQDGVVFHYRREGGLWSLRQTLFPEQPALHLFGRSLSVEGEVLVAGSTLADLGQGRAVLFRRDGADAPWREIRHFTPAEPQGGQQFSSRVAVQGGRVLISSPGFDADAPEGTEDGALYEAWTTPIFLDASERRLTTGQETLLSGVGGREGGGVAVFVVSIDGVPTLQRLLLSLYNSLGRRDWRLSVPPGLAGLDIALLSYGVSERERVETSNELVFRLR